MSADVFPCRIVTPRTAVSSNHLKLKLNYPAVRRTPLCFFSFVFSFVRSGGRPAWSGECGKSYAKKLDANNIGAFGHSLGGGGAINAGVHARVKTVIALNRRHSHSNSTDRC